MEAQLTGTKGWRARGVVVHGLGQQILARTCFAQDHDGDVAAYDPAQLVNDDGDLRVSGVQVLQRRELRLAWDGAGVCPEWRLQGSRFLHRGHHGCRPGAGRFDFRAAPYRHAVVHAQLTRGWGRTAEQFEERRDGQVEQGGEGMGLQRVERQPELELCAAVGRDEAPSGVKTAMPSTRVPRNSERAWKCRRTALGKLPANM